MRVSLAELFFSLINILKNESFMIMVLMIYFCMQYKNNIYR